MELNQINSVAQEIEVLNLDSDSSSKYSDEDDRDSSFESSDEDDNDSSFEIEDQVNHINKNKLGKEGSTLISKEDVPDEEMKELINGDPKKLKVVVCKSYLRRHGLRLSGNKQELMERIKLYIRLKEEGPRKYHLSTFVVNCTGDVCKGDIILFMQKLRAKSDAGSGQEAMWRRIAGRVVNENYGTQRQQHTFTIEVMWSSGYNAVPPMKQLLIKGRNLYRRSIRRQFWPDEQVRKRILDEKHSRGAVARQTRADRTKLEGTSCHVKKKEIVKVRPVRPVGPIERISPDECNLPADSSLLKRPTERISSNECNLPADSSLPRRPLERISPNECNPPADSSLPGRPIERISPDECNLPAGSSLRRYTQTPLFFPSLRHQVTKRWQGREPVGPAQRISSEESNLPADSSLRRYYQTPSFQPHRHQVTKRWHVREPVVPTQRISSEERNLPADSFLPRQSQNPRSLSHRHQVPKGWHVRKHVGLTQRISSDERNFPANSSLPRHNQNPRFLSHSHQVTHHGVYVHDPPRNSPSRVHFSHPVHSSPFAPAASCSDDVKGHTNSRWTE